MHQLDFYRLKLDESISNSTEKAKLNLFLRDHGFKNVTPLYIGGVIWALSFEDKTEAMRFKLIWTTREKELL
jgi:hypothetical protein